MVQGSYSYIAPGQEAMMTHFVEYRGEKVRKPFVPVNHSLFFAGEHTSRLLEVPGTMEAAVESGEMVNLLINRIIVD